MALTSTNPAFEAQEVPTQAGREIGPFTDLPPGPYPLTLTVTDKDGDEDTRRRSRSSPKHRRPPRRHRRRASYPTCDARVAPRRRGAGVRDLVNAYRAEHGLAPVASPRRSRGPPNGTPTT